MPCSMCHTSKFVTRSVKVRVGVEKEICSECIKAMTARSEPDMHEAEIKVKEIMHPHTCSMCRQSPVKVVKLWLDRVDFKVCLICKDQAMALLQDNEITMAKLFDYLNRSNKRSHVGILEYHAAAG